MRAVMSDIRQQWDPLDVLEHGSEERQNDEQEQAAHAHAQQQDQHQQQDVRVAMHNVQQLREMQEAQVEAQLQAEKAASDRPMRELQTHTLTTETQEPAHAPLETLNRFVQRSSSLSATEQPSPLICVRVHSGTDDGAGQGTAGPSDPPVAGVGAVPSEIPAETSTTPSKKRKTSTQSKAV